MPPRGRPTRRAPAYAVLQLRTDVDEKLGRLPLRYLDSHPRGDLLSRVTNDIDNIGTSLQQTLTQLMTSLLTIVGVLIMMLLISPLVAIVSLLAVPASLAITIVIVRRSQQQFVAQWASTGALNGHVEEMHTGHAIVKAFGRQREAIETFDIENEPEGFLTPSCRRRHSVGRSIGSRANRSANVARGWAFRG